MVPSADPSSPSRPDGGAGASAPERTEHFPPLNRKTVLRLGLAALVFTGLIGGLFFFLLKREGGRAASRPVVISELPQAPASPTPQGAPLEAPPSEPPSIFFRPTNGLSSRFQAFERITPPVIPVDTRSFESEGRVYTIADMVPPAFEAVCFDAQRNLWACGRYARAALFNRIRNGTLACRLKEGSIFYTCRHNGEDVAQWMIRQGWARPAPGSPLDYAGAASDAEAEKAGLWNGNWTFVNLDTLGTERGPQPLLTPNGAPARPAPVPAKPDRRKPRKTD